MPPYEKKEILEIRVTRTWLHEYFRGQIPEIDADDIVIGLFDDPEDGSKYLLRVEKVGRSK
jgi:hypothetical protein